MKTKKLVLKKSTITRLTDDAQSGIIGGQDDVETVNICNSVVVDNMPAIPKPSKCCGVSEIR